MLLESLLTKLGAAGLAAKAAAGGTAVVLAASAAGAADALPEPAQNTFDELVSAEQTVEDEGAEDEGTGDEGAEGDNSAFGERVSQDATGASDGEPGVDGCEIAREASGRDLEDCGDDAEDTDDAESESEGNNDFGAEVSADATGASDGEPGVDGQEISEKARANNPGGGEEGADNAPDDLDTTVDDEDESDEDDDSDDDSDEGGPEGTPGEDAAANARSGDED